MHTSKPQENAASSEKPSVILSEHTEAFPHQRLLLIPSRG